MSEKTNPYIQPFNHFSGYDESIKKLQERPEAVEFERLCYEIFEMTNPGKRLLELFDERYIEPCLVDIGNPNYQISITWAEGYKQAFRNIKQAITTHKQRKITETNK